ncbi:phage gp6-like head-tail connector protein [Bacillus sp. AGMB 02131]|uniref:Phage gp6-like head-tail connector protein n=1 Tax=Peribacillus faecalis TaxID=2772559 RepID=A0A927CTJ2_9BACI|nr:head-tail connector protein [Peribacillus faecalis]MBD3107176.1 phage gp6-like head-tail connector protein [Peribacillus faecalis]
METNAQKFKMSRTFLEQANRGALPSFSEVNLDFVKQYLYVDFEDDDLLLQLLIESARECILFETGLKEISELDGSKIASVLVIQMVSDLYNTRSTLATDVKINQNPLYTQMIKSIRGSFKGYKL